MIKAPLQFNQIVEFLGGAGGVQSIKKRGIAHPHTWLLELEGKLRSHNTTVAAYPQIGGRKIEREREREERKERPLQWSVQL